MAADINALVGRLNPYIKKCLEMASGRCVHATHYEVSVEHLLIELLDDSSADAALLLKHFEIDPAAWLKDLQKELETFKTGNPGRPVFAPSLLQLLERAWMLSSLDLGFGEIRSGAVISVIVEDPMRFGVQYLTDVKSLSSDAINKEFGNLVEVSSEKSFPLSAAGAASASSGAAAAGGPSGGSFIERFTTNFTQKARNGEIDPVFGRDREIRQMLDILARRRKNNPIAVGEAGVGKTAVVEGLALKVANGEVPEIIKDVDIIGLDLGLLQAGASVKGEFENRLNGVINEIKSSETPIILFIDEAHTLIGAGGSAGTGDAANLLKPALARGELKTVAATTWSEYKKYFEKDPALARRFQLVKLDEPSIQDAEVILRGLRDAYETAHNVYIRDEAIVAAASLSARYISGRQLPDKAVDVLDTACARVKINLTTPPADVDDLDLGIQVKQRELDSLTRDTSSGIEHDQARVQALADEIAADKERLEALSKDWESQKEAVHKILAMRQRHLEDGEVDEEERAELQAALEDMEAQQSGESMIAYEVTADVVARVVSDWTGVPLGSVVKDEAEGLLNFNSKMKELIKGQDHAIDVIDSGLRTAKAGLNNPDQPIGIFLLVGPSGVGKTETALGVANQMFGGERFMTTVNMSEYQEKHTVSRLVGSPAGYVGYGEGGVLTEAVRQKPYSVVLLDEVEKADLEVMNLFYQVFDKGTLSDGEGREIDFKNTVIFLTSNLASATIMSLAQQDELPSVDEFKEAIRPELQNHFKPALLARMNIVPFLPLQGEAITGIVRHKMRKVADRLQQNQSLELVYDDDLIEQVAAMCTDPESGARNIDHIINKNILPKMSTEILENLGEDSGFTKCRLSLGENKEVVAELVA